MWVRSLLYSIANLSDLNNEDFESSATRKFWVWLVLYERAYTYFWTKVMLSMPQPKNRFTLIFISHDDITYMILYYHQGIIEYL